MEKERIDSLCRLCEEAPLRLTEIDRYIARGNFTAEELTETALRLLEGGALLLTDAEALLALLLRQGLDVSGRWETETGRLPLIWEVWMLERREMTYPLLRLLLSHGADPYTPIDGERFYDLVFENICIFGEILEIEGEDREAYTHDLRVWLLLTAYGARWRGEGAALQPVEGFDLRRFAMCEEFSYRKTVSDGRWFLHIYHEPTGETVAVF